MRSKSKDLKEEWINKKSGFLKIKGKKKCICLFVWRGGVKSG
jgi:hypothetical protein